MKIPATIANKLNPMVNPDDVVFLAQVPTHFSSHASVFLEAVAVKVYAFLKHSPKAQYTESWDVSVG
jgi:hypothetical protein